MDADPDSIHVRETEKYGTTLYRELYKAILIEGINGASDEAHEDEEN